MLAITLPAVLHPLARSHQTIFSDLLIQASAAATQLLARDPRFVGGQISMLGILHTWARNLSYQPHIHYLVPGGGLAADGQAWMPARHNFLLPVKALSKIFRAKFLHALHQSPLANTIPPVVWKQEWVVHCKPVGNGRTALKYLAPYIFRVAISNRRLVKLENDQVTFRYRTSDTGQTKFCTLSAEEFIHRFFQHVLPRGFVKVRYFGFFAHSNRQRLPTLRQMLIQLYPENNPPGQDQQDQKPSPASPLQAFSCPICGLPMRRLHSIQPTGHFPPA